MLPTATLHPTSLEDIQSVASHPVAPSLPDALITPLSKTIITVTVSPVLPTRGSHVSTPRS
eukprot:1703508-Rhodomonas_salina.1